MRACCTVRPPALRSVFFDSCEGRRALGSRLLAAGPAAPTDAAHGSLDQPGADRAGAHPPLAVCACEEVGHVLPQLGDEPCGGFALPRLAS